MSGWRSQGYTDSQRSKSLSSVLSEMSNDNSQWLQCPTDISQMAAWAWWCLIFDSWTSKRQDLRDGSQDGFRNNTKMKNTIKFSRTADPRTWRTRQPPKTWKHEGWSSCQRQMFCILFSPEEAVHSSWCRQGLEEFPLSDCWMDRLPLSSPGSRFQSGNIVKDFWRKFKSACSFSRKPVIAGWDYSRSINEGQREQGT